MGGMRKVIHSPGKIGGGRFYNPLGKIGGGRFYNPLGR